MMHVSHTPALFGQRRVAYLLRAIYAAVLLGCIWFGPVLRGAVDGGYLDGAISPMGGYGRVRMVAILLSGRWTLPYVFALVERILGFSMLISLGGYVLLFLASCFASVAAVPAFLAYNLWRLWRA